MRTKIELGDKIFEMTDSVESRNEKEPEMVGTNGTDNKERDSVMDIMIPENTRQRIGKLCFTYL